MNSLRHFRVRLTCPQRRCLWMHLQISLRRLRLPRPFRQLDPKHPFRPTNIFPAFRPVSGRRPSRPHQYPFRPVRPPYQGRFATTASEALPAPPAFSILQDARPIYSDSHTAPGGPYPIAAHSTEPPSTSSRSRHRRSTLRLRSARTDTASCATGFDSRTRCLSFCRPLARTRVFFPGRVAADLLLPALSARHSPPATPEADLASANLPFDLQLAYDFGRSPDLALLSSYGSFGFLDGARGLELPASEPANEPLGIESDVPRDLNLSSYPFDAEAIKRDFPILRERVHGRPLVWLENATTTQKPQSVIDRLKYFYEHENSNVHRAAHELAARATNAYEAAREKVRGFLNAPSTREIIFVRGATEGINLIAQSWHVQKDDEIAITWLEHHANIVPWQMLCAEKGAKLRVAPVDDSGQVLLDEYEKLLGPRPAWSPSRRSRTLSALLRPQQR